MELVRHLCLAGCDVNASTEHGFTADEVAANSSHDRLATFIHHLRQVLLLVKITSLVSAFIFSNILDVTAMYK